MSEPIPYDEMRRILGLPDVRMKVALMRMGLAVGRAGTAMGSVSSPFTRALEQVRRCVEAAAMPTTTYEPLPDFVAGDRVVIEADGQPHEVVVVDVQERGGEVEVATQDPRYSEYARKLAEIRDRIRRGETSHPNGTPASVFDPAGTLTAQGWHIEPWQWPHLQLALTRPTSTQVVTGGSAQRAAERKVREAVLPRPSHTPPPWAPDPARTRRTKNGGIDMRTPRV